MTSPSHRYRITVTPIEADGLPCLRRCAIEFEHRDRIDWMRLLESIQDVLCRAIESGGSTIRDYRTAEGVEGAFQWTFQVYGKAGQPCPACGRALTSKTVAGRTSTFCAFCQK